MVVQAQLVGAAVGGDQAVDALQLAGALRGADEGKLVAGLQQLVRPHGGEQLVAALDLGEVAVGEVTQAGVLDAFVVQRAAFGNHHFHVVFAGLLDLLHQAFALGQQTAGKQQQEQGAGDQQRYAHPGHIEDVEAFHAPVLHHAVHHQVGAGADQRTGAAEDGGVAERQQQLGGGQLQALGPLLHRRNHHRHHGGVVEEGAEDGSGQDQPGLAAQGAFGLAEQLVGHPIDGAGVAQGGGHHIEHRHGDQPRVGEAGQGLLHGDHIAHQHRHQGGHHGDLGGHAVGGQRRQHRKHHQRCVDHFRCHKAGMVPGGL